MKYPAEESSTIELKKIIPKNDQIIKTIIGFCNQKGGKLIIGVDTNGSIVGMPNDDIHSTLYNFMTSSRALVSPEIAKIKIDRESSIVHNLCCSTTKGYDNELSITQHFIGFAPFLGTLF